MAKPMRMKSAPSYRTQKVCCTAETRKSTRITSRPSPLLEAKARQRPVGAREQHEPAEHRPRERGPALAVHLRDQVGGRDEDRDPGRERERIPDGSAGEQGRR